MFEVSSHSDVAPAWRRSSGPWIETWLPWPCGGPRGAALRSTGTGGNICCTPYGPAGEQEVRSFPTYTVTHTHTHTHMDGNPQIFAVWGESGLNATGRTNPATSRMLASEQL